MKSTLTLDKAGRMVLPERVRKQFGLRNGSTLELKVGPDAIVLYPLLEKAALTKEHGLYVHEGKPEGSLVNAVDSDRSSRDRDVWVGAR